MLIQYSQFSENCIIPFLNLPKEIKTIIWKSPHISRYTRSREEKEVLTHSEHIGPLNIQTSLFPTGRRLGIIYTQTMGMSPPPSPLLQYLHLQHDSQFQF